MGRAGSGLSAQCFRGMEARGCSMTTQQNETDSEKHTLTEEKSVLPCSNPRPTPHVETDPDTRAIRAQDGRWEQLLYDNMRKTWCHLREVAQGTLTSTWGRDTTRAVAQALRGLLEQPHAHRAQPERQQARHVGRAHVRVYSHNFEKEQKKEANSSTTWSRHV